MWKCLHRGLRTSANFLKTDQSNGGCIVSSVITKDFDEHSSQPYTSRSTCVNNGILRPVYTRKHIVDRNQDSREDCPRVEPQTGHVDIEVPTTSFSANNLQSKATTSYPDLIHNYEEASNGDLVCCRRCRKIYGDAPECLCFSKIHSRSWLSEKLHIHYPCSGSPSTSTARGGFLNNTSLRRPTHLDLSKENKLADTGTSSKSVSPLSTYDSSAAISFLPAYHSQKKRLSDLEKRKGSLPERSQICQNFTYCLLKLPFFSYDFIRGKGLSQLYECIQNRGKTEFGGNGNKGQRRERSEGARRESWSRHQSTQSLLEAIGLSSALLLGWFLVQCRIWHPCRERHSVEHQQRAHGARCGMFSRLMFPRARNSHQPLNAVPSNSQGNDDKLVTVKQYPSRDPNTNSVDSGNDCTTDNLSELFDSDDLHDKGFSSNIASSLASKEILGDSKENQRQEVRPVAAKEENGKEPIPMPWYPQESKPFGPITLEQAVGEAGKSLEAAHAEVLLHFALEKLEDGEDSDDDSSAVDLLTKAAQLGSSVAAFNLGICYEMGVGGVTKNMSQAYYWYKVASDSGHAAAMYNMAIYHAQGLAGLSVDTKMARQLLERASSFELPEARDALTLLTTLKPTGSVGSSHNDSNMAQDHSISRSSSSQFSLTDEEYDTSSSSDSYHSISKKADTGHNKKLKKLGLNFSHVMTDSLLFLLNEDDLCSEIALDNTQKAKQNDFKYASAIALAH